MKFVLSCLLLIVFTFYSFGTSVYATSHLRELRHGKSKIWLVENHELPVIKLFLEFPNGAFVYDSLEKLGSSHLIAMLFESGELLRDPEAFLDLLQMHGIILNASVNQDSLLLSVQTITPYLHMSVIQLKEMIRRAGDKDAINVDSLSRTKVIIDDLIKGAEGDLNFYTRAHYEEKLFNKHPYSRNILQMSSTIDGISGGDLKKRMREIFSVNAFNAVIVGACTEDMAVDVVKDISSVLSDKKALPPIDVPKESSGKLGIYDAYKVQHDSSVQYSMLFGRIMPFYDSDGDSIDVNGGNGGNNEARVANSYYSTYIINDIFGGGRMNSMLFRELREKHGLTYGIYSFLKNRRYAVFTETVGQTKDYRTTLKVLSDLCDELTSKGITEEQFHYAQRFISGSYITGNYSINSVADNLARLMSASLGVDFYSNFVNRIKNVDFEATKDLSHKLFEQDALLFVVGGNFK